MNSVSTDTSIDCIDFVDSIDPIDLIDLVEEDNIVDLSVQSKKAEAERRRRSNGSLVK
jgi:hypothetical protein